MNVLKRLLTFMAVVLAMAHSSAQADPTILNVDTPTAVANGTAFIGDGFIASGFFQGAAGSGNIDPFLRLGTNDTFERGYNTSLGLPLDDKPPQPGFTHALQLSAVPIVNIGGVNYREFLLDANQTNNGNISLNQVQIFQSNADVGLGACPRIRRCLGLASELPLGFGLFGLGPALGAHSPPQLALALLHRRQIFSRLWVKQISCHSAETFSKPLRRNWRMPRADLIWPNTGSTICFRAA